MPDGGVAVNVSDAGLERSATLTTYQRGDQICGSEPAGRLYCVVSGLAKTCTLLENGRQQTIDLLVAGDFFTVSARCAGGLTVEALAKRTVIAIYRLESIKTLIVQRPEIGAFLLDVAFGTARRLQRRMQTLAYLHTREKVGAFLVEMWERLSAPESDIVALPISRYDMADYLGLSVESVSRALSWLKREGAIRMLSVRSVKLVGGTVLAMWEAAQNSTQN